MAATLVNVGPGVAPQRIVGHLSGTYTAATDDVTTVENVDMTNGVITITPGFMPTYVKVVNVTDRLTQEWFKGMNPGDFLETAANGDKTLETDDKLVVNATTGVVTILANGGAYTDNDTMVYEIVG